MKKTQKKHRRQEPVHLIQIHDDLQKRLVFSAQYHSLIVEGKECSNQDVSQAI